MKTGSLEVKVASDSKFTCNLKTEDGSGTVQVQKREGQGNSTVRFEGLDITKIYLVEVEFQSVDNPICKKLQKSQIVFE